MSPTSWKELVLDNFVGGYNSDLDSEVLPKHFLSASKNTQYNKGVLSTRDGRQLFDLGAAATGTITGVYVFKLSNGTANLLRITTSDLYSYNVGTQTWTKITPAGGLTGTTTLAPQFITWNDTCYITDGTDPIIQWTGSGLATFITGNGAPSNCSAINVYAGYFFAFRPTLSGTLFGFRASWSDFRQPTIFNSGQAGSVDLDDTPEQVQSAANYGRYQSIYKTTAIYNSVFVGYPIYFDFRRIDTPGIIARRTLVQIPMLGLFGMGRDDVYIFDQNQARPVGKPIRQELFSKFNYQSVDACIAWVRPDLGRVYLSVGFNGSTPDTVYSYSYVDGQWMPEADYAMVTGLYAEFTSNLLVSQMTGLVSSYTLTLDQLSRLNQRQPLVSDGTYLYQLVAVASDFVSPSTLAINNSFTTAAFPLEVQNGKPSVCTLFEIVLPAQSTSGTVSVTVAASLGNNIYTSFGPYTTTFSSNMAVPIPCEVVGERFKITVAINTVNQTMAIKQIVLRYRSHAGSRV